MQSYAVMQSSSQALASRIREDKFCGLGFGLERSDLGLALRFWSWSWL